MSKTKRIYNKPNKIRGLFHPYHELCCGNCKRCKWYKEKERKKKTLKHRTLRFDNGIF